MRYIVTLLIIAAIGCNLVPAIAPDDWVYHPPQPVEVDTSGTDTTLVEVDTCEFPELILEPAFVTAYHEITDPLQTSRQIIIGEYSAWIHPDNQDDMPGIIDSLFELYRPEYSYKTYVSDLDSRILTTIIKGTNDHHQFFLQAQIRYNGWKHYFGFDSQAFVFGGACNVEEYADVIDEFPSVNIFNFRGTDYDSTDYIKLAYKILGDCKEGREWADFKFNPFEMIDTVITLFEDAGWQTVRHGPDPYCTIDLRGKRPISEQMLSYYDPRCQIIITDTHHTTKD